jgi:hypothetical protein
MLYRMCLETLADRLTVGLARHCIQMGDDGARGPAHSRLSTLHCREARHVRSPLSNRQGVLCSGELYPCETDVRLCEELATGQEVEVDMDNDVLTVLESGKQYNLKPLGEVRPPRHLLSSCHLPLQCADTWPAVRLAAPH